MVSRVFLRMVTASLLALTSTTTSAAGEQDVFDLPKSPEVVTACEGVSGAIQDLQSAFQESLRDTNDNLKKYVLELKDEIKNTRNAEECDASKVQTLQESLQFIKEENIQLTIQVRKLHIDYKAKSDQNELNALKVRNLERKLNSSLKQVEELKGQVKLLNNTVDQDTNKKKNECELAKYPVIANQVEEFAWSKDWATLRRGLEAVLSNASAAYKQLQRIAYKEVRPLWTVGRDGFSHLARLLVCAGLPVDAGDADGDGMLHGAADGGQTRTAAALLDLGADVEARGSSGRTPLMWAAAGDQVGTAKLLRERGAALNSSVSSGDTALHVAAKEGNLVMVRYLVAAGADTTAPGEDGYTALSMANIKSYSTMIDYLSHFPH